MHEKYSIVKNENINNRGIKMKAKFINYDILVNYIFIIVGVYIVSLGTNMFLLPYKLTTGGASGVATILYYIFNIPMGINAFPIL